MPYRSSRFRNVSGLGRPLYSGGRSRSGLGDIDFSEFGSVEFNPYAGGEVGDVPIDPAVLPPGLQKQYVDPKTGLIDAEAITRTQPFNPTNFFGRSKARAANESYMMQKATGELDTKQALEQRKAEKTIDLEFALKEFAAREFGTTPDKMTPEQLNLFEQIPVGRLKAFLAKSKESESASRASAAKSDVDRRITEKTADTAVDTGSLTADMALKRASDMRKFMFSSPYETAFPIQQLSEMYKGKADLQKPISIGPNQVEMRDLSIPDLGIEPSVTMGPRMSETKSYIYKTYDFNNPESSRIITNPNELRPGETIQEVLPAQSAISYDPARRLKIVPKTNAPPEVPQGNTPEPIEPEVGNNGTNMFRTLKESPFYRRLYGINY